MDARTMILWEKLPKLEKELADLKKDMDRLCQNVVFQDVSDNHK